MREKKERMRGLAKVAGGECHEGLEEGGRVRQ